MKGQGYAKAILFGEHFVVYGFPAIVLGLRSIKTVVEIKESDRWKLISNFDDDQAIDAFLYICNKMNINKAFEVKVLSSVPIKQNLGSSAALNVSFVRALNSYLNLGLDDDKINHFAYFGEVVFHGVPSGIDNSASTFGKPLVFSKSEKGFEVSELSTVPLHILAVNTSRKIKGTGEIVESVRLLKESEPLVNDIFSEYSKLFKEALSSLKKGDLERVGRLMNINHGLLTSLNLTSHKIEEARDILASLGALGSKISGAGTGGNIISLFKSEEEALNAKIKLENLGFPSFYSKV